MATTTTNLKLTKPAVSDAADISVLNANFDKIDALGGYGLGGHTVRTLDLEANGFLATNETPDGFWRWGYQTDFNGTSATQVLHGTGNTAIQRIKNNGTWQPWEWINPPMALGVEYRTTERWQGKAVYTMMVDIGLLPNASSKYASGVLPAGIYVTSIIGSAFSGYNSVPIQSNGIYVSAQGEWGTLYISTTSDYSAFTGYVTVKYTK